MADQGFQIFVSSTSSTADEWKRAMTAPESELKTVLPLTPEQKAWAERFGVSEEEYARGELARVYGQQGYRARAKKLGTLVQEMLAEVSPESRLIAVLYEDAKRRWIFRIETAHGIRNLSAEHELVEDVVGRELFESMQQLKQYLKSNLAVAASGG